MKNFNGLTVLSLESRRADVMTVQIEKFGGRVVSAPSLKEIPLTENKQALQFGRDLLNGQIDAVIFLTGVGTRYLFDMLGTEFNLPEIFHKLSEIFVVARGPKPVKVLNEAGIQIDVRVPEPNTWKEVVEELDRCHTRFDCRGKRIAVQEYGISNDRLTEGLTARGANVITVPLYCWELPDDTLPLRKAVDAVISGQIDILLITSGIQIKHFFEVARKEGKEKQLFAALKKVIISSVGPVADESIRELGLQVDFNPTHPKLGTLVAETAEKAEELVIRKKTG